MAVSGGPDIVENGLVMYHLFNYITAHFPHKKSNKTLTHNGHDSVCKTIYSSITLPI